MSDPVNLMRPAVRLRWRGGRVLTYHHMKCLVKNGRLYLTPLNRGRGGPLYVIEAADLAHYESFPAQD